MRMTNEPVIQYSLFNDQPTEPIVNVASVPHRSPFRYPGGKTWLVPRIRQWLTRKKTGPETFIEPFAGGGIVGLTVAFENLAAKVILVEIDEDVGAVWKTILNGEAEWLANRIQTFPFSAEAVDEVLGQVPPSLRAHAFQTILRNRISRGGILAPGSGRIKRGENGRGLASRWYPDTLAKRIRAIAHMAHRIQFIQDDGLKVMKAFAKDASACFFIDPPYTAAGKKAGSRLYRHSEIDHEALFEIASKVSGDFLMTYDNAEGIHAMALRHHFETHAIPMKNTHHAKMTELLISRDLSWV
jgi:DNA adenine methylase